MKKLTIFILSTIISNIAIAEFEIPNEFEDGQVTSASQMNENFQALKVQIEALKSQLEVNKEIKKVTFVGVTEEKFDGAAGHLAMGQACDAMSSGSFFCSYEDYASSIKPINLVINSDARLNGNSCQNFSTNFDSSDYRSSGINIHGVVYSPRCSFNLSVACCK
jgi:hypothetical protein